MPTAWFKEVTEENKFHRLLLKLVAFFMYIIFQTGLKVISDKYI